MTGRVRPGPAAVAGHLLLASSIARGHLERQPWAVVSLAWRVTPPRLRRPLLRLATMGGGGPVAALGLAATGSREAARGLLDRRVAGASPRTNTRLAAVAVVLGEHEVARRALGQLSMTDPRRDRLEALLLWSEGHLTEAVSAAGRVPGAAGRRLAGRLAGDLEALRPQGRTTGGEGRPQGRSRRLPDTGRSARKHEPRVLHVVTNALPEVQAGYTLRTQGIAQAQARRGHEVHVSTRIGFPVDIGRLGGPDRLVLDGVVYHRDQPRRGLAPAAGDRLDQGAAALLRLAETLRPDLLHAHSLHDNAQRSLAVRDRTGLPVLYEVRGFLEETWRSRGGDPGSDRYRLARDAETWCMREADVVVTLAETMRAEIIGRGVPADQVVVVPNAVPDAFLEPCPDGRLTRAGLGIDQGAYLIGVVSTLNDYEGVDTLLAALQQVDDPRVHLLVVGDGPAGTALRQSARDLPGRVTFTGTVPHARVRDYYAALDLFCVPRRRTPVTELVPPLKPLEALATGVPLLVSDLPPLAELLRSSGGGWALPADAPELWAARLQLLAGSTDEHRGRGQDARRWVRQQRTWPVLADRYAELYAGLGLR